MFKALKACPDAVVLKPDMKKYAGVGREIREMMRALTPLVEPISIDEAFLDLGGTRKLHGAPPARVLGRFLDYVRSFDDVWVCTRADIARHWHTHHQPAICSNG